MKYFFITSILVFFSCQSADDPTEEMELTPTIKTENVILLVIDGPRITETWEHPYQLYIPNRIKLLKEGVYISNFMHNGTTLTMSGHSSILNGYYENLNNEGLEFPSHPSIFQYFLKSSNKSSEKAWLITSKDKLAKIGNCTNAEWKDTYLPSLDCGRNGLNNGYRSDVSTIDRFKEIATTHQPNLVMINLKDVDVYGHENDWENYQNAIKKTDEQINEVWHFIQSSANYKNKTTLIVTNDHGRHSDEFGGFRHHGDACIGCKHIEFLAIGPDFKKNVIINHGNYEMIDIAKTVGVLLNFNADLAQGKVIKDIFQHPHLVE